VPAGGDEQRGYEMADPNENGAGQDAVVDDWAAAADKDLGSDWADMIDNDEPGGPQKPAGAGKTSRVLNQDEIDSLLGVGEEKSGDERTGIMAIVNSNDVTYERLPMLEVVFDRLERMLTTSVRNFTSENVDVNLDNITAQRFGDYLNSVPLPAMIAVFKAVEWDNFGLVTVDSPMIYSIVDVLLGGRRGTVPMRIEGRPYTTIETSLVERLIKLLLQDLSNAFAPITDVQFRFERMETNPRFAAIARPGNACIVFKMRIDMEDRGGTIEFLIPYATLEPARDLLLQMFMGEKFGRDSIWENHLAREIWVTDVDLEAVLEEQTVNLSFVAKLQVGSVLKLRSRPESTVTLRCGSVNMLRGKVGQRGDNLCVQVEEKLERPTVSAHD
jgi:flagellar motor switch protein FliM